MQKFCNEHSRAHKPSITKTHNFHFHSGRQAFGRSVPKFGSAVLNGTLSSASMLIRSCSVTGTKLFLASRSKQKCFPEEGFERLTAFLLYFQLPSARDMYELAGLTRPNAIMQGQPCVVCSHIASLQVFIQRLQIRVPCLSGHLLPTSGGVPAREAARPRIGCTLSSLARSRLAHPVQAADIL
jgi:hypothetical protein